MERAFVLNWDFISQIKIESILGFSGKCRGESSVPVGVMTARQAI